MNQKQYTLVLTVGSGYKVMRPEDVRGMVFGVEQHQCVKMTVRFVDLLSLAVQVHEIQ